MTAISDTYAAEIIGKMRAETQRTDEIGIPVPADPRDLLLIKLYDDLQALTKSMSFLGGDIRPVQKVG